MRRRGVGVGFPAIIAISPGITPVMSCFFHTHRQIQVWHIEMLSPVVNYKIINQVIKYVLVNNYLSLVLSHLPTLRTDVLWLWNSLPAGLMQTDIGYEQFKWLLDLFGC